jgi:hypothetical protein
MAEPVDQNNEEHAGQQAQIKNPNTLEQQDFQPESGAEDRDVMQARRRSEGGAERIEQADGTATEEA